MVIGYVMKGYPRLSETFILHEILGLEQQGFDLQLFPLLDPHDRLVHEAVSRVRAPVQYMHEGKGATAWAMLRSQRRLMRTHPLALLRVWGYVMVRRRHRLTIQRLLEAGRLAVLVDERHVGWLHAHFAHGPTSVAHFVHLLTGVPFSFSAHAKDVYQSAPDLLRRKIRDAEFVATCTETSRRYLAGLFAGEPDAAYQQAKVHLVYHGVDAQRFAPPAGKARAEAPDAAPLILAVGRLVEKKGWPDLLAACHLLAERGVAFQCAIYGDGPLKADLKRQIQESGLRDRVALRGACAHEQLPDIYRSATIFALAPCIAADGDRDGIPNVLMEAMASGLPVVTTPVGGILELVQADASGLIVPERDAVALADALERLLVDPGLRERLGAAARTRIVTRFAAAENLQRLMACFPPAARRPQRDPTVPATLSQDGRPMLVGTRT